MAPVYGRSLPKSSIILIGVSMFASENKFSLFPYLLILTGCFILFEVSFFLQGNKEYIEGFYFISKKIEFTAAQLPPLLGFVATQLLVHFIFCVLVWLVTLQAGSILRLANEQKFKLGIGLWLIAISTILCANAWCFPNSHFAYLVYFGFALWAVKLLCIIGGLVLSMMLVLAAANVFVHWRKYTRLFFVVLVASGCMMLLLPAKKFVPFPIQTAGRPNIIIIGFDSLRPDFLGYFGARLQTPTFDAFLKQSTVFTQATTPLARTFPSWVGILTGQHPVQTGIRSNLMSQKNLNLTQTLPAILQRNGYETIYATDETRFSNIGKNFGFDHIITPPMGVNDFILGSFNDFPISNLFINTRLGAFLFPYSYGNRPVYFTYKPDSFLRLIQPVLNQPRQKPLFLAVHFCITHHPYIWASHAEQNQPTLALYKMAIQKGDQMLQDFLALLNKNHLLDHALVILLSDHGEAIELAGDRITEAKLFIPTSTQKVPPEFYPTPLNQSEHINQSAGHGTDVLGLTQYRSLFAVNLFPEGLSKPKQVHERVSLIEIKAMILDLLHITHPKTSGTSLAEVVLGKARLKRSQQDFFIESDYSPQSIRTLFPDMKKLVFNSAELFQVDSQTSRLLLRDNILAMIIKSKQYADIRGHWVLALYPQKNSHRLPILVNLQTGQWTHDLRTPFAQQSPAASMLAALRKFYGQELGTVDNVQ